MNNRSVLLFVVAIIIAAFTAFTVRNKMGGEQSNPNMVKVLAASVNISAGSFVRADKDLAWIDWPKNNLNPSLFPQEGNPIETFSGAVARRSILAGEPIVKGSVVKSKEGGFMSAVLKPGMRAVTVSVNATSGNAGFIFPGDRVDLILTHRVPVSDVQGGNVLASETFIEDVRVLAVDQSLDNVENKAIPARTITLEVSPKQAESINVATNLGNISLSLRSLATEEGKSQDAKAGEPHEETFTRDTDVSRLLGDRGSVRSRVSLIRGGEKENIDFNQDPEESKKSNDSEIKRE